MRTFLFPHRLMTRRDAYVAALHPDDEVARQAFDGWVDGLDPEEIDYPQHKLINSAYARFSARLAGQPLDGVFQNVQRQVRLKTHANLAQMRALLDHELFSSTSIVAIGETRERLIAGSDEPAGMAELELAVPRAKLLEMCHALASIGFVRKRSRRPVLRSGGRIVRFRGAMNVHLQLVGLNTWPTDAQPSALAKNLLVMSDAAYWHFMTTRRASLNVRRDQLLFDMAQLRKKGGVPDLLPEQLGIGPLCEIVFGVQNIRAPEH